MKPKIVMLLWLVINIALFFLCLHMGRNWNEFKYALALGVCSIFVVGTYPSVTQLADGQLPHDLGFDRSTVFLGYGLAFGLIFASAVLFLTFIFGARYRIGPLIEGSAALHCFVRAAFHAATEEILFRDIAIRKLRPKIGLHAAIFTQAILFSSVHGFSLPLNSYVSLFFVAIFLALVKLQTGTLWTCIGIHAAWNFFQTIVKGDVFADLRTSGLLTELQPSVPSEPAISAAMFLCCCLSMLWWERNNRKRGRVQ